ncbi:MAG: YvcK family protein [Candidatus Harrisonbacteria bacterium]|nr:YvcK family protein [Candidatus Harrisonbacteria bacterium]
MKKADCNIVVIGGGSGNFTILSGLKKHTQNLTAIVNMVDDGGSSGVLRDELGVLPPGDVRQCLVALTEEQNVVRKLFQYRFEEGGLKGHSFGNLFLTALEKQSGSFAQAVEMAGKILTIQGRVLPVTLDNVRLALRYNDGEIVRGESVIDKLRFKNGERPLMYTEPKARINSEARKAILGADLIVLAPGTLHTSTLPSLLIEGVVEAIQESPAQFVYVCNLVSTPGQTEGFSSADFVQEIERHTKRNLIDKALYNTKKIPQDILERYAKEGEYLVEHKEGSSAALGHDLISQSALEAGLIRHDADAVSKILLSLL